MSEQKIRITIGSEEDAHDVLLSEFSRVVDNSRVLLDKVAKTVFGEGHDCKFRLTDLSHNSPACMVITPASKTRQSAAQHIIGELEEEFGVLVGGNGVNLPDSSLKVWEDFLSPYIKNKISRLTIESVNGNSVIRIMQTDKSMIEAVKKIREREKIWVEDIECQTSVVGKVELLNFHDRQYLKVYPRVKDWNPVKVYFEENRRGKVIKCVNKYAEIFGMGKYRSGDALPYEMKMEEIRQLPDEKDIPKFSEMRGIAPNITGGKSVQEYLDDIRKEWD